MKPIRVLALSIVTLAALPARAAVWPGAAPCAATLQACIDGVPAGEAVLVATDTPVVEDLVIGKDLTLTHEVGFSPTISGEMLLASDASPVTITVQGLTIEGPIRGFVRAGDLDLHVLGNSITSDFTGRYAVELTSDVTLSDAGDLTAEVRGNDIRVNGSSLGDLCGGVALVASTSPQALAAIENNTLFVNGCPPGAGITAAIGPGRMVTVDVLRNSLVVPNTGVGIALQNSAPGPTSTLSGRVIGNLVRGEFFSVGVRAINSAGGTLAAQLVNNTVVDHDTGVLLIANAGDPVSGEVANNIVAFNSVEGLRIDAAGVTNRHNLVFGNGLDNFPPGPGTVFADPQFVGGPSFHLLPGSPGIDAGANDAVPADVTLDLEGAPRIQGLAVDLGAFEEPAGAGGSSADVPALSPLGLVLLATVLAGLATRLLRRQGCRSARSGGLGARPL